MRCGYSDELDQSDLAMYRGRVASAMRGRRGQMLLRELLVALDAMPEKRLIPNRLVDGNDVCLLGAGGRHLHVPNLDKIDPEAHRTLGDIFNVAPCMIQEIEFVNDEMGPWDGKETPEKRYERVRKWLVENIKSKPTPAT